MKLIVLSLLALLFTPFSALAEDVPEGLIEYREKMEYWSNRAESAFKCTNRFELAMFLYDATFEEGIHPQEELDMMIERATLQNMECVIKSLRVLPSRKVAKVLNRFYEAPLYNTPSDFTRIITALNVNNGLQRTE